MHRLNQHTYKRLCSCCMSLQTQLRNDVNFNALFDVNSRSRHTNKGIKANNETMLVISTQKRKTQRTFERLEIDTDNEHSEYDEIDNPIQVSRNQKQFTKIKSHESYSDSDECVIKTAVRSFSFSLQTILMALTNCQQLINDDAKEELVKYCNDMHVLEGYIYLTTMISSEQICKLFSDGTLPRCDAKSCDFVSRHVRDRQNDILEEESKYDTHVDSELEWMFYRDLMDSVHCFLYHVSDWEIKLTQNGEKFNINALSHDQNKTFTDGLFDSMLQNKLISPEKMLLFKHWLVGQQYDSESIEQDLDDNCTNSNIAMYVENDKIYECVKSYIFSSKLYTHTFNIGYIFYYWPYYKALSQNKLIPETEWNWNKNQYSEQHAQDLYVESKYDTLKDEMFNNKILNLNINQYTMSETKGNKYMDTLKVRTIRVRQLPTQRDPLKYGIANGSCITHSHILSIIFYCDWTELSTEFAKTFRKIYLHQ
eukprot:455511_1